MILSLSSSYVHICPSDITAADEAGELVEALEDFLRREPFPYHILSEALDPFIAHIRDLMGDGISDAFFLLLDFSPSPGMDESIVTQAKAT